MSKHYRITSKFRFTIFLAILILCVITIASTILGFNTVNSATRDVYNQVQIHSGDTLWNIASKYNSKDMDLRKVINDICDINQISADQLKVGQTILVPVY